MLPEGTYLRHYRIESLINWGGFGAVFKATDTRLERCVAIKVLRPHPAQEHLEAIRLFKREMKAVTLLDHPNILSLFDFGEATVNNQKYAYLVMPYRQDGTLEAWLNEKKLHEPFPSLPEVAHILTQAAKALQEAHRNGILHLDVKPSNFLIRKDKGNPNYLDLQLADFGIAKFVNTSAEPTRVRRGTPHYMSPEQWERDPIPASDQYALAVMIYQILTYKMPFEGDHELTVQNQHFNIIPDAPSLINPYIPTEIDSVILRALSKNNEDRFSSVTAFADAFSGAITSASENERMITNQLQNLTAEVATLKVNPEVLNQLLQLSKNFIVLQGKLEQIVQNQVPPSVKNAVGSPPPKSRNQIIEDEPIKLSQVANNVQRPKSLFFRLIVPLLALLLVSFAVIDGIYQIPHYIRGITNAAATAGANNASAILTGNATATTIATYPYPSYLPGHGTIALHDSLDGTNNYYQWRTTSGCNFTDGAYHVIEPSPTSPYLRICTALSGNFNNFAVEVTMIINTGNCGGIDFGKNSSNPGGYLFQICSDGNYFISQNNQSDGYIHSGLLQTNVLTVLVNGNQIEFYVNHHRIQPGPLSDHMSAYSQGQIGFLAADYNQPTADVSYTNVKVWTLP